ncbi:MAG TPA: ABC transporter permease [Candidatus Limnocylindrales bacterium]|jgi:peptide/nickel transport system permease protein|nr:ABC transporter permease [Candidatus Limnocylindrales bacterium]
MEMRSMAARRPPVPWFVAFLARRMAWALITLFIFLTAIFFFMQVWVPYSWATQFWLGGLQAYEAARQAAGLDRPLLEQYAEFMFGLAGGDLGTSFNGGAVGDLIVNALPVTLTVFIVGSVIGWIGGELLGRLGSWNRGPMSGSVVATAGVLSATIFPPFLVFVLVRWLREPLLDLREAMGLPADSLALWRGAVTGEPGALTQGDVRWLVALALCAGVVVALILRSYGRRNHLPLLELLALPAMFAAVGVGIWIAGLGPHAVDLLYRVDMTVATGRGSPALAIFGIVLISFGQVMLLMRAGMDAERSEDYVLTGRAKGLTERAVRDRHVARNVMAPVLAGSFLTFPTVLAGMIIVEYELEMAGLSSVLFNAIEFQDIPVIMGVMVVLGLMGVGFRLVTDLVIAMLDPRQRAGRA